MFGINGSNFVVQCLQFLLCTAVSQALCTCLLPTFSRGIKYFQ